MSSIFYHSSPDADLKFDLTKAKETGLHCGTLAQAKKRAAGNEKYKYFYRLDVDTTNMLELQNDTNGSWSGPEFLLELLNSKVIDHAEYNKLVAEYRTGKLYNLNVDSKYDSEYCQKVLKKLGKTGIIYPNKSEGVGNSICIIDASAINNITNITAEINAEQTHQLTSEWHKEFAEYENLWN